MDNLVHNPVLAPMSSINSIESKLQDNRTALKHRMSSCRVPGRALPLTYAAPFHPGRSGQELISLSHGPSCWPPH